jgi:hypothetical protein
MKKMGNLVLKGENRKLHIRVMYFCLTTATTGHCKWGSNSPAQIKGG